MAIQSASAKLYTGIRCWVVDKNISAALTASFSLGNQNQPSPVLVGGVPTVFANVLVNRVKRYIADLVMTPSMSITDQRLKTFGGGNVINDGHFVPGQTYKIVSVGNTDWNAIAGTTGETYVVGSEFIAINNGTLPSVSPASFTPDDKRNPTAKTGKAGLASWTLRSSVVCKFPTYFRIDVDKLQLPQGTTCTVSFEEDWIRDGVYLESTRASSPAIGNFFTFRTPWLGASFINSSFSLPNRTVFRIKQLTSTMSSTASVVAYPIFNPGKLAALFGGVFLTLPTAVKTARGISSMVSSFASNTINLRIKQLASTFVTDVATLTTDAIKYKTPGFIALTNTFTLIANAVKNVEINLSSPSFASMTTVAVKTARINSAMVLDNSLSAQANYRIDSLIPLMTVSTSVELVTDIRFIMQTNLNSVDYLGNPLTNDTTVNVPIWPYTTAGTIVTIEWGDGDTTTYTSPTTGNNLPAGGTNHTYAQHGEYDIRIKVSGGFLSGMRSALEAGTAYNSTNWTNKIKRFMSFGHRSFGVSGTDLIFQKLFARVPYEQLSVPDGLPLAGTSTGDWRLENMFESSKANPPQISNWTFKSRELWLQSMFNGAPNFNQPFTNWSLANVTAPYYGDFVANAGSFNQPITFWKFPDAIYNSGGQFSLSLYATNMNSENWNRTLIALANALSLNTRTSVPNRFIGTVSRPQGATTNSTVYGSETYNTGTAARNYLISRGWTVD